MNTNELAGCLARTTFKDALVVVDRCTWTPDECDLLVVDKSLRVVDVEIKISRADLKRERNKSKWYHRAPIVYRRRGEPPPPPTPIAWPVRVWKHYFAMPADLWKDELMACLPSSMSGVLLVTHNRMGPRNWSVQCKRRAKPCRSAQPLGAGDAIAIARLASLRMWDAYADLRDAERRVNKYSAAQYQDAVSATDGA